MVGAVIEIPRKDKDPEEPGDYVVCLRGAPLFVVARWTGDYWIRGATKLHGGVYGYVGPIEIERRKRDRAADSD